MVPFGNKWLPNTGKTPKGTKTAGEDVAIGIAFIGIVFGNGTRAVKLWRGAKGQERQPREREFKGHVDGAKTSWATGNTEGPKRVRRTDTVANSVEIL